MVSTASSFPLLGSLQVPSFYCNTRDFEGSALYTVSCGKAEADVFSKTAVISILHYEMKIKNAVWVLFFIRTPYPSWLEWKMASAI